MHELGMDVSEEEMGKPKDVFVTGIFESFIEKLSGTSREDLNQPIFSGLKAIEYQQLHEDSIPKLTLFRKM
jgi:hypothetical protein